MKKRLFIAELSRALDSDIVDLQLAQLYLQGNDWGQAIMTLEKIQRRHPAPDIQQRIDPLLHEAYLKIGNIKLANCYRSKPGNAQSARNASPPGRQQAGNV